MSIESIDTLHDCNCWTLHTVVRLRPTPHSQRGSSQWPLLWPEHIQGCAHNLNNVWISPIPCGCGACTCVYSTLEQKLRAVAPDNIRCSLFRFGELRILRLRTSCSFWFGELRILLLRTSCSAGPVDRMVLRWMTTLWIGAPPESGGWLLGAVSALWKWHGSISLAHDAGMHSLDMGFWAAVSSNDINPNSMSSAQCWTKDRVRGD